MSITPLISAGTSRGGTTFYARILSMNPEAKMASDPFLPLFKNLRNDLLENAGFQGAAAGPTPDYFFSDEREKHFNTIQSASLDLSFPQDNLPLLGEDLKKRMNLAASEVLPYFEDFHGNSYQELFSNGFENLAKAYGMESGVVGFNDNWCSEFFPAIARSFPKAKFISVVRDVRGCVASITKIRERKPTFVPPLYSFLRSWRKHVDLSLAYSQMELFKDRFFLLKYEDMALKPEETTKALCQFLDLEYHPNMLDTDSFRPMKPGESWGVYSHFKDEVPKKGIFTNAVDRWKTFLPKSDIDLCEFVCGAELRALNLPITNSEFFKASADTIARAKEDDQSALGWRLPLRDLDLEIADDQSRYLLLDSNQFDPKLVQHNFLYAETYEILKGFWLRG